MPGSKSRARISGIQSEPTSVDATTPVPPTDGVPVPSRSKCNAVFALAGAKAAQFRKHGTQSAEYPNVPPREETLRMAVGNAIIQATSGIAGITLDSRFSSSGAIDSRPSTSASGISASTIPVSVRSAPFTKAPTLTCSSSEERTDSPARVGEVHRNESTSSLPLQPSQSLYERCKTDLETNHSTQREISLGKRIGFYRLGKELGAGNFSKVKLGVHCLSKERVAVKIMDKAKMDQKAQRLLEREIGNMELVHHPNVIRLFEVIETLGKIYLIQEYAGGGELYTYVHENGKLTEEAAKPIFAQLVSAVGHLHEKGVVHRDIKAENVIFSQPGWVKLADFGFSCNYKNDQNLTTFCGSPPYAAPELFKDPNYNGPMVDIWALGVTLYFMLVGVTPFRGDSIAVLKQSILSGVFTMPEYLSEFAQMLIKNMLQMEPIRRTSIFEIKKFYWLKTCKFPNSFHAISTCPSEDSLQTNETEREVWKKLKEIGIDEEMIRESMGKGAKDPIIGTYRIIMCQCQAPEHDKEREKIRSHIYREAARQREELAQRESSLQRSKTCTIC